MRKVSASQERKLNAFNCGHLHHFVHQMNVLIALYGSLQMEIWIVNKNVLRIAGKMFYFSSCKPWKVKSNMVDTEVMRARAFYQYGLGSVRVAQYTDRMKFLAYHVYVTQCLADSNQKRTPTKQKWMNLNVSFCTLPQQSFLNSVTPVFIKRQPFFFDWFLVSSISRVIFK